MEQSQTMNPTEPKFEKLVNVWTSLVAIGFILGDCEINDLARV